MTKKSANDIDADGADRRSAADLRRDLARRERQLRDLTEQALTFLEELAESRRRNEDRDLLSARIGELERVLAETRLRLQHAGGVAIGAAPTGGDAAGRAALPLEVVCWGDDAFADAVLNHERAGDVPVSWIGRPRALPAGAPAGLRAIVHRDAHTLAQCCNLALLSTSADVVLLLGPGHRLAAPPVLPAGLASMPPNVALLAPRVVAGAAGASSGPGELGCDDPDGMLQPQPRAGAPGDADFAAVPFAATHAVLVRRAAFEQLGMFDESLTGGAPLVDFALRARARNFEVVGLPALTVERAADSAATTPLDDLVRMQLLALHRPELLGRALAAAPHVWQLGTQELPGFLQQVLARLPAADLAAQRAALEQTAVGLARHALPSARVCDLVRLQRIALLRPLAENEQTIHRDRIAAALCLAEGSAGDDHDAAFAALARDLEFVRGCLLESGSALHAAYDERTAIDVDRHAHLARAERAEGARAAAAAQRDQLEEWLRTTQADLQRLNEHQQEIELQVLEANRMAAAAAAAAADDRVRLQQQITEQQHRAEEREHEIASLREHLDATARAARLPEGEQLPARIAALDRVAAELSSTLATAGVADSSALLVLLQELRRRVDDSGRIVADREKTIADREQAIADRERTIAQLLDEVRRRRLFPRPLRAHEQALLDRLGPAP